jgi:hypothetical protein
VNLFGGKKVLFQKRLQQNAAHLSGAQHGNVNPGNLRGRLGGLNGYLRHGFFSSCLEESGATLRGVSFWSVTYKDTRIGAPTPLTQ